MTDNNALAIRKESNIIQSYGDAVNAATAMAKSGYFTDSREASQALVKILAGQEMGFGPFASMVGINIIVGKPAVGANLMASAVKSSGRYDYRLAELSDMVCDLIFFERGKEVGHSRFTIEDARKAGTKNLDKFPRNMLFARAISNGVKWYCPDAFNGAAVYTPEELGATVDQDGNVIDIEPAKSEPQPEPKREFKAVKSEPESLPELKPSTTAEQALQDLEFEQPNKAAVKVEGGAMTYEQAAAVKGKQGEAYGTLNDVELKGKRLGLTKLLNNSDTDASKQSAALNKLEAINILLAVPESERLRRAGQQELL